MIVLLGAGSTTEPGICSCSQQGTIGACGRRSCTGTGHDTAPGARSSTRGRGTQFACISRWSAAAIWSQATACLDTRGCTHERGCTLQTHRRSTAAGHHGSQQQQQLAKLQQVQLQAAADAEALTVGSWMTLPHELTTAQHFGRNKPQIGENTCNVERPLVVLQQQQQALAPGHRLAKTAARPSQSKLINGSQLRRMEAAVPSTAGATGAMSEDMAADSAPATADCPVTSTFQLQGTDMYRTRHSAILQMALLKAASSQ